MKTTTSTRASSVTTPESFDFSDDEVKADTPPNDLPNDDQTDKIFSTLGGNIDDDENEMPKHYFTEAVKLGRHVLGIWDPKPNLNLSYKCWRQEQPPCD